LAFFILFLTICKPYIGGSGFASVYSSVFLLLFLALTYLIYSNRHSRPISSLTLSQCYNSDAYFLYSSLQRLLKISIFFFFASCLLVLIPSVVNNFWNIDLVVETAKFSFYCIFSSFWISLLVKNICQGKLYSINRAFDVCILVCLSVLLSQIVKISPLYEITSFIWSDAKLGFFALDNLSRLRFYSTFYNSNWFGLFGSMMLPYYALRFRLSRSSVVSSLEKLNSSIYYSSFILLSLLFIIVSGSRSAFLATAVSLFILLIASCLHTLVRFAKSLYLSSNSLVSLSFFLILLFLVLPKLLTLLAFLPRYHEIVEYGLAGSDSYSSRFDTFQSTIGNLSLFPAYRPFADYFYTHNSYLFSFQLFGVVPGSLWLLSLFSLTIFPFYYFIIRAMPRSTPIRRLSISLLLFSLHAAFLTFALTADAFQSTQLVLTCIVLGSIYAANILVFSRSSAS